MSSRRPPPALFPGLERPLLFAHRGASRHAPENTLEAFDLALMQGADVLEMDVHLSADGEVVVIHDREVNRVTNGHGLVRALRWSELADLDAGYHFAVSGEPRFRGKGVGIPRLEDVLRAFSRAAFNIELKQREPSMVPAVLEVLERVGPSRLLLTAGDDFIMRALEAARPGCALGLSRGQALAVVRDAWLGRTPPEQYRGRALQIPPRLMGVPVVTRRVIDAVHHAGLELHLWVVNDPHAARAWLGRGIDGLMADDPGLLADAIIDARQALAERGG